MKIDYSNFNYYNAKEISAWNFSHKVELSKNKKLLVPHMNVYHYTSLDKFWKIIESNSFWATHVRFSNDGQEFLEGQEIINKLYENHGSSYDKNCYMICFCNENDLLSQWREYAQNGVSVGMDFSRESIFTILNNDEKNKNSIGECRYSAPIKVLYTVQDDARITKKNPSFFWKDGKEINFKKVKKSLDNRELELAAESQARGIIPYIKHGAFKEELESRLVFELSPDKEKNHVCFINSEGCQKPYLKIKYGDTKEQQKNCTYVDIGRKIDDELISTIKHELLQLYPNMVFNISDNNNCDCEEIYISTGQNQRKIFLIIDNQCRKYGMDKSTAVIKIWCDGYLPIRSILVGPNLEGETIKESIALYCKTHHWLKHIVVKTSPMPYRGKQ